MDFFNVIFDCLSLHLMWEFEFFIYLIIDLNIVLGVSVFLWILL